MEWAPASLQYDESLVNVSVELEFLQFLSSRSLLFCATVVRLILVMVSQLVLQELVAKPGSHIRSLFHLSFL